jgi:hypothetical protein
MKLSEDVPLEKCLAIDKLTSSHGSSKYQKSIIEDDLVPRMWNVVILNSSNVEEKNGKCAGIYTSLDILEQAFPNENPLTAPICDGKRQNIYVLYSDYTKEIKDILPVACSIKGASFEGKITPKMSYFLHYVNAKKEILDAFRKEILRAVEQEKMGFFSKLSQLDQDILKKNMTDNTYKRVLRLFWSYFFDKKFHEYNIALEYGNDLTYELFSYVHDKMKEKEKTYKYKNHPEYVPVVVSVGVILEEHKRKEDILLMLRNIRKNPSGGSAIIQKQKYLSVINFYYAFILAIEDRDHKSFLENIFK